MPPCSGPIVMRQPPAFIQKCGLLGVNAGRRRTELYGKLQPRWGCSGREKVSSPALQVHKPLAQLLDVGGHHQVLYLVLP